MGSGTKTATRLQDCDSSPSAFVRENVARFINMTPETFSGIYGAASRETHWLSYELRRARLGQKFATDEVAAGKIDISSTSTQHTREPSGPRPGHHWLTDECHLQSQ
ncbi:type IV secretory system conjugative DNA transfer family protein [Mesorhizobium ciceri]|uniref:type IV secretory system conjugative DNA transfer family protein n=1 Tax=Mesorhizobium sp. M7A.F.Ca.US.006.01.1.1 TaxID=2496707 RepID=UPI001CD0EFCE|nr:MULTISPECIES: type IV secretory system conjugative DNA transfer family protein [Mesorhizobium]MBZ9887550.1 type IV secretory system conjugative DNA transfer family protein [Mesorhizobium sp. BR1-1-3]